MGLHIRSADSAPGVGSGADEFFGRTPASVQRDRDLTLAAKAIYGVITRLMSEARQPTICEATMQELAAETGGITERYARQLVAELETRGHVVRERIRTKSGSPQGIRPLGRLRGRKPTPETDRTRNPSSDCTQNDSSGRPEPPRHAPGTRVPGDRNQSSAPLLREEEETKTLKIRLADVGGSLAGSPPPPPEEPDDPEAFAAALADLKAQLPPARDPKPTRRARERLGANRQVPPEASSSPANPGESHFTENPDQSSRDVPPNDT